MKNRLRMSYALKVRAAACARAAHASLIDWTEGVLINWKAGKLTLGDVVKADQLLSTTAQSSESVNVCPFDCDPDEFRAVIAIAVKYCEERNPPPFKPELIAGVHYTLGAF
tara:strand:+ start:928 stop:1260 length:333 start_codon:yes stop_codon:yes gene_type:complete